MTTPLFDLTGKTALVTGGMKGIGKAVCRAYIDHGARVMLTDLDAEGAARAAKEIGPACRSFFLDVTIPDTIVSAASETIRRYGGIDILVNNAGINLGNAGREPIDRFAREDWHRILSVDLDGVFEVSRHVVPYMRAGGGRIVNIASVLGLVPARLQSAFVAAKAAVIQLTKSMAIELAPDGILVNAIAPGSTLTEMVKSTFLHTDDEKVNSLLSHIPLHRQAEPEEIAGAAVFFASPASSYVTGTVLPVDGGWAAGYMREW